MFGKTYTKAKTAEDIRKENLKNNQRIRRVSFIYKYPKAFVVGTTISSLLLFFSKPLYDIFFAAESLKNFETNAAGRYPKNFHAKWLYKAKAEKDEKERQRLEKLKEFEDSTSVNGSSQEG